MYKIFAERQKKNDMLFANFILGKNICNRKSINFDDQKQKFVFSKIYFVCDSIVKLHYIQFVEFVHSEN